MVVLLSQISTLSTGHSGPLQDRQATELQPAHNIGVSGQAPLAPEDFHPVIQEFQRVIEEDPILYLGFHQMFAQVPHEPRYDKDPNGDPQVCISRRMFE
jgi:Phophatidylserine decarboxylase